MDGHDDDDDGDDDDASAWMMYSSVASLVTNVPNAKDVSTSCLSAYLVRPRVQHHICRIPLDGFPTLLVLPVQGCGCLAVGSSSACDVVVVQALPDQTAHSPPGGGRVRCDTHDPWMQGPHNSAEPEARWPSGACGC